MKMSSFSDAVAASSLKLFHSEMAKGLARQFRGHVQLVKQPPSPGFCVVGTIVFPFDGNLHATNVLCLNVPMR
jgi:hypothetical protein